MRGRRVRREDSGTPVHGSPRSETLPESGRSRASTSRARVVLPDPDSPTIPSVRPRCSEKLTSSTARSDPNRRDSPLAASTSSCVNDACSNDASCTGETCACHGSPDVFGGNTCVSGNCHVDGDCGVGGYCSPTIGVQSCGGIAGYYCHTASDACVNDSDCASSRQGPSSCMYSTASARWECTAPMLCGTGG